MKRPLAYITAAWSGDPCEATEQAAKYCRAVYEAGFSPICPMLYQPLFLRMPSSVVAVIPSRWATDTSFFMLSVEILPHTTST